jgi:tetratricopeptide (TPR) repeat protein
MPAAPARPFRREEMMQPETLQRFRATVAGAAMADFDAGVAALAAGDFLKAERSLKSAQQATPATDDSTAALTYLAATYAAAGDDLEASAVWKIALFDGSQYSQIYEWLIDALIRVRFIEQAQSFLLEAVGKWPNDARFTTRLAMLPR